MSELLKRVGSGWNRFWFTPQKTSTLALFRIAFGTIMFFWTLSLIPNLFAFFGSDGIMPTYPELGPGAWGLLQFSSSSGLLVGVLLMLLMASAALAIGFYSRIASVLVWVGVMAFSHRNPLIGNSGDELVGSLALFLALAPSGAALSVDRWRAAPGRFWEFPTKAPWALRLVQIQLSAVYLSAVWQKIQGQTWRDGTAVSYALRIADVGRVPTPEFITHSVVLSELMTFGTLALEASLGVLVWNKVLRPWVLAAGVMMHLGIDFSILVGFFSFTMICAYISFVPAETAERRILAFRDLVIRRVGHRRAAAAEGHADELATAADGDAGAPHAGDAAPESGAAGIPVQTVRALIGDGGMAEATAGSRSATGTLTAPEQAAPEHDSPAAPSWGELVAERRGPVNGAESRSNST
jgi:hypothetical protein